MVKNENIVKEESKFDKFKLDLDLNALVTQTRAVYGKKDAGIGNLIATGDSIKRPDKESDFIAAGGLDFLPSILGAKSFPVGTINMVLGKPDSGKSTFAACLMAANQMAGTLVILWDSEGKFQKRRFDEKMGGCSSKLMIVRTNSIEDGVVGIANIVNQAKAQNPKIKILICWDSVGASINSKEDSEDTEDFSNQPGVDAREISKAIKKINKLIFKYQDRATGDHSITCIVVNQVYSSIGPMSSGSVARGGTQLQYLCSSILELTRKKDLNRVVKSIPMKYGVLSRLRVKKNHLFDGDQTVAEMDVEVSASGIKAYTKGKVVDEGEIVEEDEE